MAVSTCAEMVARCLERDQTGWRSPLPRVDLPPARSVQPLLESQIEVYWKRMNIEVPRPSRWKLLFGRR